MRTYNETNAVITWHGETLEFTAEERTEIIDSHITDYKISSPRLYVGTYAKYNGGSLEGAWLDLDTFDDYDEFMMVCHLLHCDEDDSEFMFQDCEYIPESLYSESGIGKETFDKIKQYKELCDQYSDDAVSDYMDEVSDDLDGFEDKYICDNWDSFADDLIDDELSEVRRTCPALANYFDTEAYKRDLSWNYTITSSGAVFSNY